MLRVQTLRLTSVVLSRDRTYCNRDRLRKLGAPTIFFKTIKDNVDKLDPLVLGGLILSLGKSSTTVPSSGITT